MAALITIGVILLLFAIIVVTIYNGLITLRNHINEAWSNIDTELKRRYDLIPNLIETVKGYAAHERETLENVIHLRNKAQGNTGSVAAQAADENMLVAGLGKIFALAENYPDLKADRNFLELQQELANTEDRIQAARRFYNGNVRDYRVKAQTFPGNIVAGMLGLPSEEGEFFEVEPVAREVPKVQF